MALEDFTTYTPGGLDAATIINVASSTRAEANNFTGTQQFYLYKDFGENFFATNKEIEINIDAYITPSKTNAYISFLVLSSEPGDYNDLFGVSGKYAFFLLFGGGRVRWHICSDGATYLDNAGTNSYSPDVWWYYTLTRAADATSWTIFTYDAPERLQPFWARLIDSPFLVPNLRYLQVVTSRVDNETAHSMYNQNAEIIKPAVTPPPIIKPNPLLFGQDF